MSKILKFQKASRRKKKKNNKNNLNQYNNRKVFRWKRKALITQRHNIVGKTPVFFNFMLHFVSSLFCLRLYWINNFRFFLNRSNFLPIKFLTSCFAESLIRLDGLACLTKQSSSLQADFTNREQKWEKEIKECNVFSIIKSLTIALRNVRVNNATLL